ncbi:hypothetical protein NIES4074_18010 [Cylindrospermum sp. NIES-4074]|nr:hypothetical protein NIES4074_18010 [Cylindrospermum sp. NIES-4074]
MKRLYTPNTVRLTFESIEDPPNPRQFAQVGKPAHATGSP